jgi:hypothetical protein
VTHQARNAFITREQRIAPSGSFRAAAMALALPLALTVTLSGLTAAAQAQKVGCSA